MDVALQHISKGVIDKAMPLDEGFVLKCGCDNVHNEMPAATGGTCMSCMFRAFIDNLQRLGLQGLCQAGAYPVNAFVCHVREIPS
jgi:hypothetical protein